MKTIPPKPENSHSSSLKSNRHMQYNKELKTIISKKLSELQETTGKQ